MRPSEDQIWERLPIWDALSEFFLDTELQPEDHRRIADTLAASRYSEKELEDILTYEVYPVCKFNIFSMAGEWAGFDSESMVEKMAPLYDKRPRFRFGFRHRWMFGRHWKKVSPMISEIRNR